MMDRSPIWIGLADLLLCVVSVVIIAVNPVKAQHEGVEEKAEYLLSIEWDVEHYDADADIWLVTPKRRPVFFDQRQVGCATLDQDNRGWPDSMIVNDDGSTSRVRIAKETIALRCKSPGRYDLGVNLYSYTKHGGPPNGSIHLLVRVAITALNPEVKTVFTKDIMLDRVLQTANVVSFEMSTNGAVKFVSVPLAPVTDARLNQP